MIKGQIACLDANARHPSVRRPPRQRSRPRPRLQPPSRGQESHRLPPNYPVVRNRSWQPSRPRGRRGSGLPRCARPPASPRGRSPVRCMAWCSGGRSAKCTTAMWRWGRSARRGTEAQRRAGAGARPPVLRTHPLVASLDELPPTVTRGEETTPACEGCVREDHPSTHAPPLLATRSHTVSSSQAVCWECPSAVGRSIASRVSKVDSGMHEPGEASQRESMEMLGIISALR